MNRTYVLVRCDRHLALEDDAACVDLVTQEESGGTSLGFAIDHCPVDRGCTSVLRQEGCMEIEGAKARHCPNHLG